MRLHRADGVAELLPLDEAGLGPDEFGLCAYHLTKVRAPSGWSVVNRIPVSAGSATAAPDPRRPAWAPGNAPSAEEVSILRSATSRLLRRAFRGVTAEDAQVQGQLRMPF